jgi:hypothetical protein
MLNNRELANFLQENNLLSNRLFIGGTFAATALMGFNSNHLVDDYDIVILNPLVEDFKNIQTISEKYKENIVEFKNTKEIINIKILNKFNLLVKNQTVTEQNYNIFLIEDIKIQVLKLNYILREKFIYQRMKDYKYFSNSIAELSNLLLSLQKPSQNNDSTRVY